MLLNIEIINSSNQTLCQSKCGIDWSIPHIRNEIVKILTEIYGNFVRIEYTDNAVDRGIQPNHPVLLMNGQVRLIGPFDLHQLIETIETQLEVGGDDGRE
jgi:hypothetical protein